MQAPSTTKSPPIDIVRALKLAVGRRRQALLETAARALEHIERAPASLFGVTMNSHDVLFKASNVFPFNLFPDTICIDREKLTIINRFFFRVAKITSVPIRDILSVEADVGPFFGSIYMTSRYFFTNPTSINFLWKKDAIKMQRILQGYIIANEQSINCSDIPKEQLVVFLEDLGQGEGR